MMRFVLMLVAVTRCFSAVQGSNSSDVSTNAKAQTNLRGALPPRPPRLNFTALYQNSSVELDEDVTALLSSGSETSSSTGGCSSHKAPQNAKCTGCPPMYNGKLCASTTWYEDMTKGSCGCGDTDPVPRDYWTLTGYTMAVNAMTINPANPLQSWCPSGCGTCYRLCHTGGSTQGRPGQKAGVCEVFKVVNRCGDGYSEGHPDWCSQHLSWSQCRDDPGSCKKSGNTNIFGYPAHFDLQDFHRQVTTGLQWDNAEVTFEQVSCDRWAGPKGSNCRGCQR